eukprot:CAMPEP_0194145798 /NCGR_PEP_ID=MMETSP0152-20130528/18838_1 /TAXON_ID=1049557 /ORGANISM="Thalassiothrix antarctica, Strain L6-D1" /LENGTH=149 /DNA_ID=CAMNT_0038846139 /DNA_START=210 /DNA_END=662 /DNA_ORIENTATION=-
MVGFGAPGDKRKKEKELKLRPKQQWDRYFKLKTETALRVAVRIKDKDSEWLEVGDVKSKENAYPEIAVAKHRGLISEHARRLFPLQILKSAKMEWAFLEEESEEWVKVDITVLTDAPEGIEKLTGFEGRPDPATGFYCHYKDGRLTNYK